MSTNVQMRIFVPALVLFALLMAFLPGAAFADVADDSAIDGSADDPVQAQTADDQVGESVEAPASAGGDSAVTDAASESAESVAVNPLEGEGAAAPIEQEGEGAGSVADDAAQTQPADGVTGQDGDGTEAESGANADVSSDDPIDPEAIAPAGDDADDAQAVDGTASGDTDDGANAVGDATEPAAESVAAVPATPIAASTANAAAQKPVSTPNAPAATAATAKADDVDFNQQVESRYAIIDVYGGKNWLYATDASGNARWDWGSDWDNAKKTIDLVTKLFIAPGVSTLDYDINVWHFNENWYISLGGTVFNNSGAMPYLESVEFMLNSYTGRNSLTHINATVFKSKTHLTSVENLDKTNLVYMCDQAFWGCTALPSIVLPRTLEYLSTSAFYNCTSLTNVYGLQNTKVTEIGETAFYNCRNLKSVTLPSTCVKLGGGAFERCSSLSSVSLNQGLTTIGWGVFRNCIALTSIDIPSSVNHIGNDAFEDCSKLHSVTVRAMTAPELDNPYLFGGTHLEDPAYKDSSFIYIPRGCNVESYTTEWYRYNSKNFDRLRYIQATNVKKAAVSLTQYVFNWTGVQIKPTSKVIVTYGGRTLKRGVDYWLSYKNNINQGIATVVVHGKGDFSGAKGVNFRIGGKVVNLPNGYFEICKSLKKDAHVSVNSGNANVRGRNYTANERFQIVKCANGAYRLVNVATGKALGVTSTGNVAEGTWANKWAQQWIPEKVKNTSWIQWRNHKTGKFLSMPGTYSVGANVATATTNGKGSQQWLLRKAVPFVSDGNTRRIAVAANGARVVGASNNSTRAGANANLGTKVPVNVSGNYVYPTNWNDYDTYRAEAFVFHQNANGYYTLENLQTGYVLQSNNSGNVLYGTKQGSTGVLAQQWAIKQYKTKSGEAQYYIINAKTGKMLTTRDKSTAYHANVMVAPKSRAIRWVFVR